MIKYILGFILTASLNTTLCAQDYRQIHKDLIIVDGHNDVIISSILDGHDIGKRLTTGHTDIPRLIDGGVDVQVFAVWSDDKKWTENAFRHANEQIDSLEAVVNRNADYIEIAKSYADIQRIQSLGKIAAVIGIEGGNMIEQSTANLEELYARGARYLTLTWNYNLPWVTAAAVEDSKPAKEQRGLSKEGKSIIRRMNELGMMVDLSHSSKKTFYDVMKVSKKPVLVSHSNAAALTPHSRNLDDKQLKALKKNKGVIGVNFYSGFIDSTYDNRLRTLYIEQEGNEPTPKMSTWAQYTKLTPENRLRADAPMECLLEHIDYLVGKVGIDHVAIGSDFDGIESAPIGLGDVSSFPNLTKALLDRGYSKEDVAKIMGLNFLRILKENEG